MEHEDDTSQAPVSAAPKRHSFIPPNMISRDACQEASVASRMAALAASCDTEPTNCLFMQLAPEIRLEIYSYLLVIHVDCVWYDDQRKAIAINRYGRHRRVLNSTGLAPQILRTCKAINREAAPVLYGENIFRFQPREDGVFRFERFAKENIEALCRELYSNPVALWTEGAASILSHRTFAVFLRQIGQQNAASLKKLIFVTREAYHSKSTQDAGQAIQMVTRLLKAHAPGLRCVAICRGLDSWDELEHVPMEFRGLSEIDGLPTRKYDTRAQSSTDEGTDGIPLMLRREEQEAMHKAVADMIQEITWLKGLSSAGFDEDVSAYEEMKELQTLVKTRR